MDCETARFLIEAFHDDELSTAEAAELLAHLETCEGCRLASSRTAALREACRRVAKDRCPEELKRRLSRLCQEVSAAGAGPGSVGASRPARWAGRGRTLATVAVATGLGFGLGLGFSWWRSRGLAAPAPLKRSASERVPGASLKPLLGEPRPAAASPLEDGALTTVEGEVFCLRCALENLLPETGFSGMDHRPVLRTRDGQLWTVASGLEGLGGAQPSCSGKRVRVTARLHPRFASLDIVVPGEPSPAVPLTLPLPGPSGDGAVRTTSLPRPAR